MKLPITCLPSARALDAPNQIVDAFILCSEVSPYEPPGQHFPSLRPRQVGRFGWWAFLLVYTVVVAAIAIPAIQNAAEYSKGFVDDPSVFNRVNAFAMGLYLVGKYLPLCFVVPWLGKWMHKSINESAISIWYTVPLTAFFACLTMLASIAVIAIWRKDWTPMLSFNWTQFAMYYVTFLAINLSIGIAILGYVATCRCAGGPNDPST